MQKSEQDDDNVELRRKFGSYFSTIVGKIVETEEGDRLVDEGPFGYPNVKVLNKMDFGMSEDMPAAMGFEYPNTVEIPVPPLPSSGDYAQPEANNPHFEAKVALAFIHELLHRKQARRKGMGGFFKGSLEPLHALSAQILIEAENYARTAQTGWRIAHDPNSPLANIADYMKVADPNYYMESTYAIYASAMQDKAITPENELIAMRAVVDNFLFASGLAQRYTTGRLSGLWTYLQSGRLSEALNAQGDIASARQWMASQPNLAGLGPDSAEYVPADFIALGDTPVGNILELDSKLLKNLLQPHMAMGFMTEEETAQIGAINEMAASLRRQLNPVETSVERHQRRKESGNIDRNL